MKIYSLASILVSAFLVFASCQQKSTKRSIEVPSEVPTGGHWTTRSEWKAHWVKHWLPKTTYIPIWKKVWTPVTINEWVPYAPTHR